VNNKHHALPLGKEALVSTVQKDGWAAEPVKVPWQSEKSLVLDEDQTMIPWLSDLEPREDLTVYTHTQKVNLCYHGNGWCRHSPSVAVQTANMQAVCRVKRLSSWVVQ
jgi:hypothetical protein